VNRRRIVIAVVLGVGLLGALRVHGPARSVKHGTRPASGQAPPETPRELVELGSVTTAPPRQAAAPDAEKPSVSPAPRKSRRRDKWARLGGVVVDPYGAPVARAEVRTRVERPAVSWGDVTHTDDEGRFEFRRAGAGNHTLRARGSSSAFAPSAEVGLELRPHEVCLDVVLCLGVAGRITGVVLPDAGRVAYRRIDAAGAWDETTRTDEAGRFAFEGLAAGDWKLGLSFARVARIEGWERDASFLGPNHTEVHVEAGATVHVELGALPASAVRIRGVVRRAGAGVPGVVVHAIDATGETRGQALGLTGGDGAYELTARGPGTYTFAIGSERGRRARFLGFQVPAVAVHELDFDLPTASIRGVLVDGEGEPVGGESVFATLSGPLSSWVEPRETTSRDDGSFELFEVAAGAYTLRAGGAWDWDLEGPRYAYTLSPAFELREGEAREGWS